MTHKNGSCQPPYYDACQCDHKQQHSKPESHTFCKLRLLFKLIDIIKQNLVRGAVNDLDMQFIRTIF